MSPMDKYGYLILELETIIPPVARTAKKLIVEVNKYMPRVHGEGVLQSIFQKLTPFGENHIL